MKPEENNVMQKICIVGAGAIGGMFAVWLDRLPNTSISVLARGETLDVIKTRGLRLQSTEGESVCHPQASNDANELGVQDLVVLAVKAPALPEVAANIKALLGPNTKVLIAMNGVPWWFFQQGYGGPCQGMRLSSADTGDQLLEAIPSDQVIGCVVHLSAKAPSPGCIELVSGKRLIIGEPSGEPTDRVLALSDMLDACGFEVEVSERIQDKIWYKLWGNMTMNPVSALTGATCDQILDDEFVRGFINAVMSEAKAVGAAFGCEIDQDPEDRHIVTRKLGAFKTSMLQDVEAGRLIELDSLVATVQEIGAKTNVATPYINALFGLTRLMAKTRGLYSS